MTHWASSFYDLQGRLTGCYDSVIHPYHHELATRATRFLGGPGRVLELGAGGGQFAVAARMQGHAVTAIELVPAAARRIQALAGEHTARVRVINGDFYTVDAGGPFDLVCYWDGFGIGADEDQRALLRRVAGWLAPGGAALVEAYTPWYWARHAGFTRRAPGYVQTYDFDADTCTLLDTYAPEGEAAQTQRLRCYSPADLRLLLQGTGVTVQDVWPGGRFDGDTGTWHPSVPLRECMSYTAVLRRA